MPSSGEFWGKCNTSPLFLPGPSNPAPGASVAMGAWSSGEDRSGNMRGKFLSSEESRFQASCFVKPPGSVRRLTLPLVSHQYSCIICFPVVSLTLFDAN